MPVLTPSVDIANARLRFANGCIANLTASRVSLKRERKLRIFQADAYVSVDYGERRVRICRREPDADGQPSLDVRGARGAARATRSRTRSTPSCTRCATREPPPVTGWDGLRALEVAHVIRESVETEVRAAQAASTSDDATRRERRSAVARPARRARVLLVAGEASGDLHGADLLRALRSAPSRRRGLRHRRRAPARRRHADGRRRAARWRRSASSRASGRLRTLLRAYRDAGAPPARGAARTSACSSTSRSSTCAWRGSRKRAGIPVLYYIGPQVWAWRRGRVRKIARRVDRLAVVFPFEPGALRARACRASSSSAIRCSTACGRRAAARRRCARTASIPARRTVAPPAGQPAEGDRLHPAAPARRRRACWRARATASSRSRSRTRSSRADVEAPRRAPPGVAGPGRRGRHLQPGRRRRPGAGRPRARRRSSARCSSARW